MGRNSSGTRGGLQPGDATYKGSVGKPEPLVNMKDPALYKATKEAISRYHAVLGVRQRNVKLAELSAGTYGVHVTANGKSEGVYLNKSISCKRKSGGSLTQERLCKRMEYKDQQGGSPYCNARAGARYMECPHDRGKPKSGWKGSEKVI